MTLIHVRADSGLNQLMVVWEGFTSKHIQEIKSTGLDDLLDEWGEGVIKGNSELSGVRNHVGDGAIYFCKNTIVENYFSEVQTQNRLVAIPAMIFSRVKPEPQLISSHPLCQTSERRKLLINRVSLPLINIPTIFCGPGTKYSLYCG